MSYFDDTLPPDTEGVSQGASRIRAMKTSLNTILDKICDASANFLSKFVTGDMIANDAAVDANRAITSDHLKDSSVINRVLADGVLSADTAGHGKMADGFFTADAEGQAKVADAFVILRMLADGLFTADATGRAKFASGFVNSTLLDTAVSSVLPVTFTSSQVAIPAFDSNFAQLLINEAHGLGAVPRFIRPVLVCTANDSATGYVVGDEVDAAQVVVSGVGNKPSIVMWNQDATNVRLWLSPASNPIVMPGNFTATNTNTGFYTPSSLTGNFQVKLYAYK